MKPKQSIPKEPRYTVWDFNKEFPNDDACLDYIKEQRWPGGVTQCESKKCGQERKHYRVTGRTAFACDHCGKHIYPLAGTIFEKSTTPLRLWFYAMYLMGSTRCGISAKQIQRETGVTYKTAWRMFRQIRPLLSEDDLQMEGSTVEMDETYMGGRRRGRRGRPPAGDPKKKCVVGVVERKGRVVAATANNATRETLHGIAKERILKKSTVFTDELSAYDSLERLAATTIGASITALVFMWWAMLHTHTIDGFWSLVKRGIGGVYHSVSQKYLQSYLDEYSFRYNRRHVGNQQFRTILERVWEKAS